MNSDSKRCKICLKEKPLERFYRVKDNKDGRSTKCGLCYSRQTNTKLQKNREAMRAKYAHVKGI